MAARCMLYHTPRRRFLIRYLRVIHEFIRGTTFGYGPLTNLYRGKLSLYWLLIEHEDWFIGTVQQKEMILCAFGPWVCFGTLSVGWKLTTFVPFTLFGTLRRRAIKKLSTQFRGTKYIHAIGQCDFSCCMWMSLIHFIWPCQEEIPLHDFVNKWSHSLCLRFGF